MSNFFHPKIGSYLLPSQKAQPGLWNLQRLFGVDMECPILIFFDLLLAYDLNFKGTYEVLLAYVGDERGVSSIDFEVFRGRKVTLVDSNRCGDQKGLHYQKVLNFADALEKVSVFAEIEVIEGS